MKAARDVVSLLLKNQASLLSFELGLASGLKDESVSDVENQLFRSDASTMCERSKPGTHFPKFWKVRGSRRSWDRSLLTRKQEYARPLLEMLGSSPTPSSQGGCKGPGTSQLSDGAETHTERVASRGLSRS